MRIDSIINKSSDTKQVINQIILYCLLIIIFILNITRMRIFWISLFLLALFSISQQITIEQLTEITKNMAKSPFVNLLLIYDTATETGLVVERMIQQFARSKEGYLKANMVDCNKFQKEQALKFQYCSPQLRTHLPALIFSDPPINKINKETGQKLQALNRAYEGGLSQKALFDFATPLMKAYSQNIRKLSQWNKLQQKYKNLPVILHCANKKTLSPFYKALTANFRNTIVFGHALPDQKGQNPICDQFQVQKYPALLLNGKQRINLSTNLKQMIKRLQQFQSSEPQDIYIQEQIQVSNNQITVSQLEKNIFAKAQPVLLHIAGPSGEIHSQWNNLQKKYNKMFKYYEGQGSEMIKQIGVKRTPAIVYYPKSVAKKQIQKTVFTQGYNFEDINAQLNRLVDDFTVPLASQLQMQQFTSMALKDGKLVVMLYHSQQIPLSYKMLSNHESFKETMTFFRMRDPAPQIMNQFQLKKLPALFIMTVDQNDKKQPTEEELARGQVPMNLKLAQFTGKFIYDQLSAYLSYFVQSPKQQNQPDIYQKQVSLINSKKTFKNKCLGDFCYLLLLNGSEDQKQNNQGYITELQKISPRIAPSDNLAQIDAICHSQVLRILDIQEDQLPTVVYINSKFEKYTRLIGRIQEKALVTMSAKIKANKANYRGYQGLKFQEKDCSLIHKKLKQQASGSQSVLDQEQTAILQEIRKQEEQKKRQMQEQAKKNSESKQSKKKKKRRPKKQWEQQQL